MRGPLSPAFSVFVCALVVFQTREADLPENFCQGHLRALAAQSVDTQNNHTALDCLPSLSRQCCIKSLSWLLY